jgi:hypothetical protein
MDRMVEQAVKQALNQPPQPVPQQQQGIPIEVVAKLTECKVISPEQGFNWVFKGQPPTEYLGGQ